MTASEYPQGIDCVWIASDAKGQLAAFVTGGDGPIPDNALSNGFHPIEDIESLICDLEVISDFQLLISMPRPDDYIDMAKRGFFVYDWRDIHRTEITLTNAYEKIACPLTPIKLVDLPEALALMAERVVFAALDFASESAINVQSNFACAVSRPL